MTSKERYIAAAELKPPDRVPVELRFAPELEIRLRRDLGLNEEAFWEWIGRDAVTVRPVYKKPADVIKYADPTIRVENDLYYDIYNVPFRMTDNGNQKYLEPAGIPPLPGEITTEDIEAFPWPLTADWDYSGIGKGCDAVKDKAAWCRTRGCFLTAMFIRGEEQFLTDMLTDSELAESLLDKISRFIVEDAEKSLEAAAGKYVFVEYNDDVATQRGMMISPDLWRKMLKPRLADFCRMVKKYGAKLRLHSCGSIYPIIPDLIDIGVDILNPIQALAADMDPFKIKADFGRHICLHGGLDIQELLPRGTVKEVKEQVKRLLEMGEKGGYILAGTHTLQADIPTANIVAIVDAMREVFQ
ncbi:MAG: hypothetical protein LBQ88_07800 [Treponema sp.]|jgi:uroporphyrinogen decarboxylase|nr:hypothetical protein [Treponema sp.]